MSETYLIVGDNGEPIGMADMDKITDEGTKLAFAFAAHSNDPGMLDQIQAETPTRASVESFGYVLASALRVMTEDILSPSFDVAHAYGTDLRAGMRAISEGRQP
jgi:hypothetical protein